jgi:hypothetical protein
LIWPGHITRQPESAAVAQLVEHVIRKAQRNPKNRQKYP